MDLENLGKILSAQPKYRIIQAKKAIFQDLISDWDYATIFPKELRKKLNQSCPLSIDAKEFISKDGRTVKALITLSDNHQIETVLMKHKDRNTICVSTQVGCPLNCKFCATGKMGFKRNLKVSEIIEQVLFFARYLKSQNQKIANIVYMGMGEPFLNYENAIKSIKYLNDKDSLNLGIRHFSISTSGIPDKIKKFANENLGVNLAFSLHAADENLRSRLMPINRSYPLSKVLEALDFYQKKTRRKIMFEYILIDHVNDSFDDAKKLINLTKNFICVINLIPYNTSKNSIFKPSSKDRMHKFKEILEKAGLDVIQRFSYGKDINAACGQLAAGKVN